MGSVTSSGLTLLLRTTWSQLVNLALKSRVGIRISLLGSPTALLVVSRLV